MASQQLPERRPKKIDLNLLPPKYLPRKLPKLSIALVILIVVAACLPFPIVLLKADVDAQCAPLETRLAGLEDEYGRLLSLSIEARELQDQIDAAESKLVTMDQDYETFQDGLVLWSEIIAEIDDTLLRDVTLTSITQKGSEVTLVGTATRDDYVHDYATALEEREYFSGVTPTSIVYTGEAVSFTMIVPLSGGGGE